VGACPRNFLGHARHVTCASQRDLVPVVPVAVRVGLAEVPGVTRGTVPVLDVSQHPPQLRTGVVAPVRSRRPHFVPRQSLGEAVRVVAVLIIDVPRAFFLDDVVETRELAVPAPRLEYLVLERLHLRLGGRRRTGSVPDAVGDLATRVIPLAGALLGRKAWLGCGRRRGRRIRQITHRLSRATAPVERPVRFRTRRPDRRPAACSSNRLVRHPNASPPWLDYEDARANEQPHREDGYRQQTPAPPDNTLIWLICHCRSSLFCACLFGQVGRKTE